MKTIQQGDIYKEGGFYHSVTARYNDIALIEKKKDNHTSWEVIRVQQHKEFTIAGKTILAGEHTPRNEDWGTHGWTYTDYHDALKKYCELSGDKIGWECERKPETPVQ